MTICSPERAVDESASHPMPPSGLAEDPTMFLAMPYHQAINMPADAQEEIHIRAAARLFDALVDRIPVLKSLASQQGVTSITSIEDIARLLFAHSLYKSYPNRAVQAGNFSQLSRWLASFTSLPIPELDYGAINCVDDWLTALDRASDLRVTHTSGTSGKLSFIPRSRGEWDRGAIVLARCVEDWLHGIGQGPDLLNSGITIIQPSYEWGAGTPQRSIETMRRMYSGDHGTVLYLYPQGRLSADVLSLGSRLSASALQDDVLEAHLADTLRIKLDEFRARADARPALQKAFFEAVRERFAGQQVLIYGTWPVIYDWAADGLAGGASTVFSKDSLLLTGGGTKGRQFPADWQSDIFRFLGFDGHLESYAMTEVISNCPRCRHGHYHIPPMIVPILLDVDTGSVLARRDGMRGRLGILDLLATTYWGGVLTGDLVTLGGWERPCPCGVQGPHIRGVIERIASLRGGDDKITCAGIGNAHERAIDELARLVR